MSVLDGSDAPSGRQIVLLTPLSSWSSAHPQSSLPRHLFLVCLYVCLFVFDKNIKKYLNEIQSWTVCIELYSIDQREYRFGGQ